MDITKLVTPKNDEQVLMVVHGSLIPLWPKMVLAFIWLVLPFFLLFPLFSMHLFGVVVFLLLLVSALGYGYQTYAVWRDTVCVITDSRVVDADRVNLFRVVKSSAPLHNITDVSYEIKGFWQTIFRYGTVSIGVKDSDSVLEVYRVRHPARVHDLLKDLYEPTSHVPAQAV